jgi:hypothetical protein
MGLIRIGNSVPGLYQDGRSRAVCSSRSTALSQLILGISAGLPDPAVALRVRSARLSESDGR